MAEYRNGYVKMHRKMLDSFHGDGIAFAIFSHLLLKANWEDGKKLLKKQKVLLKRGQTVCSLRQIGLGHGWAKTTVERAIKRLQEWDTIETVSSHHGTIVTIKNYDKYQSDDVPEKPRLRHKRDVGVDTTVDTTVDTGVDYSEEVKKEKKKKLSIRETTWPENHQYAKAFTNLNRIDPYREIFDLKKDDAALTRNMSEYNLTLQEIESLTFKFAEWADGNAKKITSPRGTLSTFAQRYAKERQHNQPAIKWARPEDIV